MALDETIKAQLKQYLELLESDVVFQASLGQDERSEQVRAFFRGNRSDVSTFITGKYRN